jgi:hypothetical protein
MKLNVAYLNGATLVAMVAGAALESVWVFVAVLAVLLAGQMLTGNLRFKSRE